MDLAYLDGSPLHADLFTWDPVTQVLTTQTSDYETFLDEMLQTLLLTARYENVPVEVNSDT